MRTCESVDLPEPFGPITACTSPDPTAGPFRTPPRRGRRVGSSWRPSHAAHLAIELAGNERAQRCTGERHRQVAEHLVEEAGHDEPLGDRRRDATALEVEPLVLVDRA